MRFHALVEQLEIIAQRQAAHDDQLVGKTERERRHGIDHQHQYGCPRAVTDDVEHLREHARNVNFEHFLRVFRFRRYDTRQQVAQVLHCDIQQRLVLETIHHRKIT